MNLENYIINSKGFIENSMIKTPIYLKNLNIDITNDLVIKVECANTRRNIKYTHAKIYFFQYLNPNINKFFDAYTQKLNEDTENLVINDFEKYENIYLSNKILNGEMEYITQRKLFEDQLGNNLPLPSLLLKKTFIQKCKTEKEKLNEEEDYESEDIRKKREIIQVVE